MQQMKPNDALLPCAASGFAIFMVISAILGGIKNYSPVPFWDMWDGTVNFLLRVKLGDYSVWWAQHNEHRILLARAIFWIDEHLFGGLSKFSIVANYLAATLAAFIFFTSIRRISKMRQSKKVGAISMAFFVTGILFSWTQKNNFSWAFQSQFFLAYSLPLAAFVLLAESSHRQSKIYFFLALVSGTLSAGTMANGSLALPLLSFYAIFLGLDKNRIAILVSASAITLLLYFYDYHSHPGHDNVTAALTRDPIGLLRYSMMYLGSPLFYFSGQGDTGRLLSMMAGILLTAMSAVAAIQVLRKDEKSEMVIALLFFILFVGASAVATAGGRLMLGIEGATSERYTTPALMAWTACIIVVWGTWKAPKPIIRNLLTFLAILLAAVIVPFQLHAFDNNAKEQTTRLTTALALSLGISDTEFIKTVFPNVPAAMGISRNAIKNEISVFGNPPYMDLYKKIGRPHEPVQLKKCPGTVLRTTTLPDDQLSVRADGWIQNLNDARKPHLLTIEDQNHRSVGFALTSPPPDDNHAHSPLAKNQQAFQGYLLTEAVGLELRIINSDGGCATAFTAMPTRSKE